MTAFRRFITESLDTRAAPRLLKAHNYDLFEPGRIPDPTTGAYAILSHTWRLEGDEITYQDMVSKSLQELMTRESAHKIRLTCEQAKRDSLDYVWIDTCCIDKTSSAELSEAINSMFAWYNLARVCYVYMSDVDIADGPMAFCWSRWFTRAWRLQELLAPKEVRFYDRRWKFMGRLADPKCAMVVSKATGIPTDLLLHKTDLRSASIAQRMSWAAKRHATRVEDRAYSLLGIFAVQMPMIYGEGYKAFIRLQEQIIQTSTDHSIFCWGISQNDRSMLPSSRSLLAPSPAYFAGCHNIVENSNSSPRPYQMTNRGPEITLPVRVYLDSDEAYGLTYAKLDCIQRLEQPVRIALSLQRSYDHDAEAFNGFKPWTKRSWRRRREAWDHLSGRTFDWHFVASYARRAFAVGHSSHGRRVEAKEDLPFNFREQTIVTLRDYENTDHVDGTTVRPTSNPLADFNELQYIAAVVIAVVFMIPILLLAFLKFVPDSVPVSAVEVTGVQSDNEDSSDDPPAAV